MRYSLDKIKLHREQIIQAISALGVVPKDLGNDSISVSSNNKLYDPDIARLYHLLEELSVLNESLEYKEA
jgi:hypothetical protein